MTGMATPAFWMLRRATGVRIYHVLAATSMVAAALIALALPFWWLGTQAAGRAGGLRSEPPEREGECEQGCRDHGRRRQHVVDPHAGGAPEHPEGRCCHARHRIQLSLREPGRRPLPCCPPGRRVRESAIRMDDLRLKNIRPFSGLSKDERATLARLVEEYEEPQGTTLVGQG